MAGSAPLLALASLIASCASPRPAALHAQSHTSSPAFGVEVIPAPLRVGSLLTLTGELGQVVFHLNIRNRSDRAVRLSRIEIRVYREGAVLSTTTLEEAALRRRLRATPWVVIRDRQTLAAAHRWHGRLQQSKGDALVPPKGGVSLTQQLWLGRYDHLPDALRCVVVSDHGVVHRHVPVERAAQKTMLRLPFAGRWQVLSGHRFDEAHADLHQLSQSFAYDLVVVGDQGETSVGNPLRREGYHAYGRPVLAAAAGVVAAVNDGVRASATVGRRPSWGSLLQRPWDGAGNFVVVEHEGDEYSAYLHLQAGIALRVGDRVAAGRVIGRCGDSGNSLEPHLHFQLQDGPDPLTAVGRSARFGDFTFHYGHLKIYVPADRPMPLPSRLPLEAGRSPGAADISRVFPL